jgi:MFS family permease
MSLNIPILSLLVTYLHELGHALASLLTGGHVISLQVNLDGSGVCTTSGGISMLIIAGGYLGSILFGNLMLYFGIKHKNLSKFLALTLSIIMILVSIIWFSSLQSFAITFIIGFILAICFLKIAWSGRAFMIGSGAYSILYIIKDYNVGPSSDLQAFSRIMGLTPTVWMYFWLAGAIIITIISLYFLLKHKEHKCV